MSWKKALRASGLVACGFLAPAALFAQGGYLDVYIAKLKPEKAAEAEAIAKKITDANRNNNGDPYTLVFVTPRESYADVDKGNDAFMASVNKAFGKEGSQKILNEWNNCLVSVRTQLRIRRSDLSNKMPDAQPVSVSQVVDGENNGAYYITFLRKSLGGFDKEVMLSDILGKEGMEKFEKPMADVEQRTESPLYRSPPELSYPPKAVPQAPADYWIPKPVMASAKPKAKTPAAPAAAKSTDKSQK